MQGMEASLTECGDKLEKKYDNVYSKESEEEVMKKLIDAVEKLDDGCKTSKSLLKAGYEATK